MENLFKILTGTNFKYDENTDYEKDGHIYCKACNDRLDSEPMEFLENNKFIFRNACKCKIAQKEKEEQAKKLRELTKIRANCFINKNQMNYTFENADDSTDKKLLKKAKNYVKYFEEMKKNNIGLFLYGSVGSGKTYISCAIANEIITKYAYRPKMKNFAGILNDLQSGSYNFDRNKYIEDLTSPILLIIDDFGIERNTEYALENIYNVINARCEKSRPTIITTNLNYKDIQKKQENLMLARIYSRLIEMCQPLIVVSDDRRKKLSEEKKEMANKLINENV